MNQPKIYNNLAELKADVRSVVLTELAEIRGLELSEDDIIALAERFRGWPPEQTQKSLQLELERLRGRLETAVNYGKEDHAKDLQVQIRALEMRATARAGKREYRLPAGPRWIVLDDNHLRRAFGRHYDRMSTDRSRALVSLLTHLTLGVGQFPAADHCSATVEDVIQAEKRAIWHHRDRFPQFLAKAGDALRFYAYFERCDPQDK